MSTRILVGDCRQRLAELPDRSVQMCVTSPPYFGLRDYGVDQQIGLETTVEDYVAQLVAVFREVRRALHDDGTLWLNLGDSYANDGKWGGSSGGKNGLVKSQATQRNIAGRQRIATGLKAKDLIGIPWRVAFALQADGWYLRADIIWHKTNPMPESVTDRPTKAHEYIFLLSKRERYYYDRHAIAEPSVSDKPAGNGYDRPERISRGGPGSNERWGSPGLTGGAYAPPGQTPHGNARAPKFPSGWNGEPGHHDVIEHNQGPRRRPSAPRQDPVSTVTDTRNARDVWTLPTQPFAEAHFATFPPTLADRCIKAGSRPGDCVLDPFAGAGTVGLVADRLGRDSVLIELNGSYTEMMRRRIEGDAPMFTSVTVEQ